jgi:hypothetical protein
MSAALLSLVLFVFLPTIWMTVPDNNVGHEQHQHKIEVVEEQS